jgi:TolA-binding protein
MAVEFLFRAGDLAQGIGNNSLSQECYSSIISSYAGSSKAPAAMFMKAFVTDQRLGDKEGAKRLYQEFLEKYPDHTLAVSAKATIDQLNSGLTDEELVKMFEQRTAKDSVSR